VSRLPDAAADGPIVVIGVGNPYRCDDGVGHRVVEALIAEVEGHAPEGERPDGPHGRLHRAQLVVSDGEPGRLIECWRGAALAVVVDAVVTGSTPGRLRVWDGLVRDLPARAGHSTHAAGIGEARALAAALDALPARLVVVGVEAGALDDGTELSDPVAAAVPGAVRLVKAALATTGRHPAAHLPEASFVLAHPPHPRRVDPCAPASPPPRTGATP
jgi:hydrogenase maturation protease